MRKYYIKGLEIFHGFLLLSGVYCCIMQQISKSELQIFVRSFLLIPVVGILSVSVSKVKHFWQYFLIGAVTAAAAMAASGGGYSRVWIGVCAVIAVFSYFVARAGKRSCWLDTPVYPWLVLYLGMYLLGERLGSTFLVRYAALGAGIYYLVCNIYVNLKEVDEFVRTHSSLERLPVKRLGRINGRMMWIQSGVIAAAMCAAPFLGIDQMIRQAGSVLRRLIVLLLSLLPQGEEELLEEAAEAAPEMMMEAGKTPSAFLLLLYKILDIIGWMFAACLVLLCIWLILKKIYEMYMQFNAHTEENGDRIERLIAPPTSEKKKMLEKQKKENLFWDRSPNGRIRKFYKRRIWKDLRKEPEPSWTPAQLERDVEMPGEEKEKFHFYYEKARYGNVGCTKEEMQDMMKLR